MGEEGGGVQDYFIKSLTCPRRERLAAGTAAWLLFDLCHVKRPNAPVCPQRGGPGPGSL